MEILRIKNEDRTIIVWKQAEGTDELEDKITLSESETEYYNSISSVARRREWMMSRFMIRHELGDGVSTAYHNRKPYLIGSDLFISISHCDDLVALAISSYECGVDIEDYTRNFDRVSPRFLSEKERSFIKGEDIALAWSIKEAAYKRIGVADIDFASMFFAKKIDRNNKIAVLEYNGVDYLFSFLIFQHYYIVY